jgi:histidine triad (HIT) family protein
MYNHAPENYICPLCQIAKGEPTTIGSQEESVFYRDEFITAFIAGKWWRSNPGHVIVMPTSHIENLYDIPDDIGHKIFDLSKRIALALKETYKCDGVSTKQHNEPAGNQEVWHYHLHVLPRYEGDNHYINDKNTYWPTTEEKQPYADKLRDYFKK